MDIAVLLEKAWDKGAWCVIAVALLVGIHRAWQWLKPFVEQLINSLVALIKSLEATTKQQAAANEANAVANTTNAKAIEELKQRPACQAAGTRNDSSGTQALRSAVG